MRTFSSYLVAYLANSVWQGALFYAAALLACRIGRRWTPESKHRLWSLTFLAQIVIPAACLVPSSVIDQLRQALPHLFGAQVGTANGSVHVVVGSAHLTQRPAIPYAVALALAILYAVSIAFFAVRLGYQLREIRRLKRRSRPALLPGPCRKRWDALCTRFNLLDAEIKLCPDIQSPVTIGIAQKLLLIPPRFLTVARDELDAAFAHELAHMRRNDYAKNVGYELLFVLAAYHPCIRLTRAWLAETREMVCDAEAARALHGAEPYAHALLRLAAFCLPRQSTVPSQAIGIFDANTLERRLMSLKTRTVQASWKQRLAAASACTALLFAASASAFAFRVGPPTPVPQSQGAAPSDSLRIPGGVMAGQVVSTVHPVYPEDAKQARIMGSVVLAATIGTDGHIVNLTALSGPQELQASALDAVRQWVYKPYLLNGSPVEVQTTITVNYQLAD